MKRLLDLLVAFFAYANLIPATPASRMNLISNDAEMTDLIIKDAHAAGTEVPIEPQGLE